MSWDRDEAANLQESVSQQVESTRELVDLLKQYIERDSGIGGRGPGAPVPRGTDSGSGIDARPIVEFNNALKESLQPIRVFVRSIDMLNERLEELYTSKTMQEAAQGNAVPRGAGQGGAGGSYHGGPGGFGGFGGGQPPRQAPTWPASSLVRPSQIFIPNQYGGFNVYGSSPAMAGQVAAQPTAVPSQQSMTPAQQRRRLARRRFLYRQLARKRAWASMGTRAMRGAYFGGLYGGVRGAFRGGVMGAGIKALSSPYVMAAGLVASMPFMMNATLAMTNQQVDANRPFSAFTQNTTQALVKYDVNNFMRNIDLARATEGTALPLIQAQDAAQAAKMPFDIMMRNTGNVTSSILAKAGETFFNNTAGIWEGINNFVTKGNADAAGRVAGDAATGAMIGGAIGLLTIPFLGWFGPALGAAVGGMFGAAAGLGKEFSGKMPANNPGGGVFGIPAGDANFLDMRFAPKPRKI